MKSVDDEIELRSSSSAFEGPVFSVRRDEVRYADGSTHRFDVVRHGGSVAIVAMLEGERLILVRQYRHPAGRYLWELPAGMIDPGEVPANAARRELEEETGYRANRVRALCSLYSTPGFCDETLHFFVASGLTAGLAHTDDDERIGVTAAPLAQAKRWLADGEIADCKTALAIAWLDGPWTEIWGASSR